MIITSDGRVRGLLLGETVEGLRENELSPLRDALQVLDAAWRLEDTLYTGRRIIRVISRRDDANTSWIPDPSIGSDSSGEFMMRSTSDASASAARRSARHSAAEPMTPGRFLREKVLLAEGLTQEQLARAMGVSRLTVNEIANDRRAVTSEMALRLEAVTRISAELWLNLQRAVDLYNARVALAESLPRLHPITRRREFVDFRGEPEVEDME